MKTGGKVRDLKLYLVAIVVALTAVLADMSGLLSAVDQSFSDGLYQKEKSLEDNIFIIGIDAKSLEDLGPFHTWSRAYMAEAIELLNSDPKNKPAAIGVDVMYFGDVDKDTDEYLSEVCSSNDNIVMASFANFNSEIVVKEDGSFYYDDYYIDKYEVPYDTLKLTTKQGFINAMPDKDDIIRSSLHQLTLPSGETINSFAYELYRLYAKENGLSEEVIPPMNSRNQWYIPFYAKPDGYNDGLSFSDLLNGEISPDMFAGKVVLIGPYARGLLDGYVTAIDHSIPMYGVEIHANIIDTLIHKDFKSYVANRIQYFVLFVIVFLCIIAFHKLKVKYTLLLWIFFSGGYILFAKVMYNKGSILTVIYIPLTITIVFITSVVVNYLREKVAKRKVVDTFKRYVAPQVVDEIFKEGTKALELGGKMTDIACLFVDIRGFTPMSESLEPQQVVGILNTYLDLTSNCILKHNGTLDKFIGDATMAIFNAPLPQEDYIYQAVLTAWDMLEGSDKLSQDMTEQYGKAVNFGIGIHSGKAVVGNIGTKFRMDYTAIGDTVNTAARLESIAKPGQILISRAVYDKLEGRIKATSLGTGIHLKGKNEELEVFAVDAIL